MTFSVLFWQLLVISALTITGGTIVTLIFLFIHELRKKTLW